MGWHKVTEFESVSSSDDNPFAGSRVQPTGKVSVKLSLVSNKDHNRGKGLWKFNSGLLCDNNFIDLIKNTIKNSLEDSQNLECKELI